MCCFCCVGLVLLSLCRLNSFWVFLWAAWAFSLMGFYRLIVNLVFVAVSVCDCAFEQIEISMSVGFLSFGGLVWLIYENRQKENWKLKLQSVFVRWLDWFDFSTCCFGSLEICVYLLGCLNLTLCFLQSLWSGFILEYQYL